ncbi:HORMA domain-containing protein 1 [Salarias fasciatus]|uniref:HORMA domain-containing protein 1 n=1 Tax=Salarias fasciatus TaxID=181472 RepID=UPI0011765E7F|nr:HORMA domain-containing protein 1-like [Salarias fasciatus]
MASVQQLRTSQEVQLTPDQVVTEQQSLIVMKKLLAIAVSGITYLRGIFPGKAYGKKYVDGQEVVILREEHSCPGVIHILHWMQGCFEAIQKKYLRYVVISISADPENPQKVLEVYQFKIQYNTGGALMDFESNNNSKLSMSCGNTKAASILLVRKLYTLMQNLGPLPDTVCLSMKLAYYDDITPLDYQPPGFKEAESGTMEFESEPLRLTMGEVVTPFHSLKLDMTTERRRIDQVNSSDAVTDKWTLEVTENDEEEELTQSHAPEAVEEPDNTNADLDNTKIPENAKTKQHEDVTEVNSAGKKTPIMEPWVMRTRSGRIIKPPKVSGFHIPNSQEAKSPKKRKLSEPKKNDV